MAYGLTNMTASIWSLANTLWPRKSPWPLAGKEGEEAGQGRFLIHAGGNGPSPRAKGRSLLKPLCCRQFSP
jgi:hypothetical protein